MNLGRHPTQTNKEIIQFQSLQLHSSGFAEATYEIWRWDSTGPIARQILRPGASIELTDTFQGQRIETPSTTSPSRAK